ncbi:cryptochrome-1-like [Topomyia yanbarensis]|uniref:cryptochrome-1-like n=1 Tax=Topomyia yanbarensis TaxID=2498891 RepID=UPI00273BC589|nr:cryptochrome-1-like [Topomyia yanbarensis]XP_058840655.1 cryptochrome-1-like [Topomyia yanbarensis]
MASKQTVIHWFRKGLRVHDNPALATAVQRISDAPADLVLRPVFILDPAIRKWLRIGANRWRFLQQSLEDLDKSLRKINSRLYVVRGDPTKVFPLLFQEWNACLLTYEYDIEPYAVKRDAMVQKFANEYHVEVLVEKSHTIFDPNEILSKNGGKVPLTYQKYGSLASTCKQPNPVNVPCKLPGGCHPKQDKSERKDSQCYDVPDLEALGVQQSELGECKFPGGETEGLRRLREYMKRKTWVCSFEKPKTSPNSLEPSTTVLSPYLKFGCLSSRLFMSELNKVLKGQKHSQPPVSLVGQLMWREFYYCAAAAEPNFDKMVGNKICLQIPWITNKVHLEAWTYGRTGYPFIDAIMRQLRQEGWIHHLARHAVACFLTRGDLWISWEEGQRVFEELLLDADWALNAGNWMWLSASAFFHQYFRVYSPVAFGKKTDPEGRYIRKYVPELAKFPPGIIYEPWKASPETQAKLRCVIGKDYPNRIVIHEEISKQNIRKMTEAYRRGKEVTGNDEKEAKPSTSKRQPDKSPELPPKKMKRENTIDRFLKR